MIGSNGIGRQMQEAGIPRSSARFAEHFGSFVRQS